MSCTTKFIGRLLIASILISSAWLHLNKPQNFVDGLSSDYSQLTECASKYMPGVLPSGEGVNWVFWTKILGAFEGIIAILIVMGDCWGGFLLFLNLVVSGIFDYQDVTNILQWQLSRQTQFARYLFLIGTSLLLMSCSNSCKKSCQKACSQKLCQKSCEQKCKTGCQKQKQGKQGKN